MVAEHKEMKKPQQIAPLRLISIQPNKSRIESMSEQRTGGLVPHPPLHTSNGSLNHLSKSLVVCSPKLGKLGWFVLCIWFHVTVLLVHMT